MRKEVALWFLQAKKDLDAARKNLRIREYYVSAFLCQQAVEKALKAYYIERLKQSPGTTHSLIFLASKAKLPKRFFEFLMAMAPEFVTSRYPDVSEELPYKLYTRLRIEGYLAKTDELLRWIEGRMKK